MECEILWLIIRWYIENVLSYSQHKVDRNWKREFYVLSIFSETTRDIIVKNWEITPVSNIYRTFVISPIVHSHCNMVLLNYIGWKTCHLVCLPMSTNTQQHQNSVRTTSFWVTLDWILWEVYSFNFLALL